MAWTGTHGRLLARAFEQVLGHPEDGAIAFSRCLASDVVRHLAQDDQFAPQGWDTSRVADHTGKRTITADAAVESREDKGPAKLLLVDTGKAGAGMDGIYSASREVRERDLFKVACRLAGGELTSQTSSKHRRYAERAVRMARRAGSRHGVSPWDEFDFLVQIAERKDHPGAHLHRLGLWPIRESEGSDADADLETSRKLVDRLLGVGATGLSIPARIDSLQLEGLDDGGHVDIERFLHEADAQPLLIAMAKLAEQQHLWVGVIQVPSAEIQAIELSSWRLRNGKVAKWSGLVEQGDNDVPQFIIDPDADAAEKYSTLEVRWKPRPSGIGKGTVDYRVAILTNNLEEELAARELSHSARAGGEKCRFNNDDFESLDEDALISAKAVVSVVGNDKIAQESEEFLIRCGQPPEKDAGGAGRKVRTFSEGLIELGGRESITAVSTDPASFSFDNKKNAALLRTRGDQRLSFQVPCPPLIREVEKQWDGAAGKPGRWRVKVRESGVQAGDVEFLPFEPGEAPAWTRVETASRRFAVRFAKGGSVVGQVYDDRSKAFDSVREYILAWAAVLKTGDPALSLCNTVEVQSQSRRTIGLIVLPMHPLRLAWHAAYDNLALHAACEEAQKPKDIRDELRCLDGALFPAFLPNPAGGAFVFADTLGFHAVGMVPDTDPEPKAATAILARALGNSDTTDNAPTVGGQSAKLVGAEIIKYLDCHETSHLLHIHAIRAGDGLTMAKSLGHVDARRRIPEDADDPDEGSEAREATRSRPTFSLEMYPSPEQRGIAGRHLATARERRRSGAGVVSVDDHWMLESLSLPGGVTMPRLRWAKKDQQKPDTAAHLAVAFDTFESEVRADDRSKRSESPFHAFGLLSFYEREFTAKPTPAWRSGIPAAAAGERHPSERGHTERLERLQSATQASVAKHVDGNDRPANGPMLHTGVSPEKEDNLKRLHALCDWVVTLDRNAGIEYFDSPRDNRAIYDAYVIDCVPEREDLGCLQLITSTSNLDEVRNLLDCALDRMGLSWSLRNARFLLGHLKALSGRLAIRLTGNKPPTSELIALAVSHANCQRASAMDACWLSLNDGFIVPADDVRDLVPPLKESGNDLSVRPDLIYVTTAPRKGLQLRFVEIKYRRDLRASRSPDLLKMIREQTDGVHKRWTKYYSNDKSSAFRAIRRAKLSRVLRFYPDKARRHCLPAGRHAELVAEIDRMVEKGGDYPLGVNDPGDLGWVFCPEYAGREPLKISPDDWVGPAVFLFGAALLPDSDVEDAPPTTSSADSESDWGDGRASSKEAHETDTASRSEGRLGVDNQVQQDDDTPSILLGQDAISQADVRWPLTIKGNPHLLIAGLPGMGKTTCLLNLSRQMIDAGVKPIVFSYHEDIDGKLTEIVDSVRFIDFNGLGFNPLNVVDRENRMAHLDVAGAMRDIFAAIYPELGDIQADRIRQAIRDSFAEAGWPNAGGAEGLSEPAFGRFLEILRADPRPNQSLRALLARLGELDDYGFFEVGQRHGSLWDGGQPTVVGSTRHRTTTFSGPSRRWCSTASTRICSDEGSRLGSAMR